MSRQASVEALPTEIIQHVLASTFDVRRVQSDYGEKTKMRYAWLAAMARVSRAWPPMVYPVLYRNVGLLTRGAAERFLATLERHAPQLAPLVLQLVLPGLTTIDRALHGTWRGPAPDVYRRISRLCPNVRAVSVVHKYLDTVLGDATWRETLERLHLFLTHDDFLVPAFPGLRILLLAGPVQGLRIGGPIGLGACDRLETLKLHNIALGAGALQQLLAQLRPTLRALECKRVLVRAAAAGPLVSPAEWTAPVQYTLATLSLAGCARVGTLRHMTALKRLVLDVASLPDRLDAAFLPEGVEEVTLTTAASHSDVTGSAPQPAPVSEWEYARRAREIIVLDAAARPHLRRVIVDVAVHRPRAMATFSLAAFLLKDLARERGMTFELHLDIKFYCNGDSFQWVWPPPTALQRISVAFQSNALRLLQAGVRALE